MKRALVFLVFGPTLATAAAFMFVAQTGGLGNDFAKEFVIAVFFFTLSVSTITGCFDGVLSDVPVALRTGLTAGTGAFVASGSACALFSCLFPSATLLCFAIGGAAWMGACSLLANDYVCKGPAVQANSLLRN